MRLPISAVVLGALALAGCQDRPAPTVKTPDVAQVFPHLIIPMQGKLVARSGSEDALQLVFETPMPQDQILAQYRTSLTRSPWQLVGDTPSPDGAVTLFAERNGVPLWIRVTGDPVAGGTRVEMSGALVSRPDSAAAGPAASAAAADTARRPSADTASPTP